MRVDALVESVLRALDRLLHKPKPARKAVGWSRPHFFSVDDTCVYCAATRDQARLGMKCKGPA